MNFEIYFLIKNVNIYFFDLFAEKKVIWQKRLILLGPCLFVNKRDYARLRQRFSLDDDGS